ncbi:hypothetical protein [Leptospira bouyouniensis]|uniref:hypothetical protein n=1 Tax=Leptospira bouyouniensis TaxID=2484911 RepID=UPI00109139FF|nr:hypothetical protein [Leptospira bouyouniensis]TGM88254.1 hypothetical protein EHQ99_00110 [Leptospira bouyouniensis]
MKKQKIPLLKRYLQATVEGFKSASEVLTGLVSGIKKTRSGYSTPEKQRKRLRALYEAEGHNGETLAKTIINGLTAWISGNGINVTLKKVAKDEKSDLRTNIEEFLEFNKLYSNKIQSFVRNGLFDAEVLLILEKKNHPIFKKEYVKVRYIQKDLYNYKVEYDDNDPDVPIRVKWKLKDDKEETVFDQQEFVLVQFGKSPKLGNAIPTLERLDDILKKFADSNDLFGTPAPVFKVKDFEEAVKFRNALEDPNKKSTDGTGSLWDAGNLLIMPGDAAFLEPSGAGAQSFKSEFELRAQMGSGSTGYPIHLMGFVSLFGTKAGADSILEQINTQTMEDRQIWKEAMYELIVLQAIMMGFSVEQIRKAEIITALPLNTQFQLMMLSTYYLPMYKEGLLDLESFVEMIPNVDPEVVKERLLKEKENKENADRKALEDSVKNFKNNINKTPALKEVAA